MCFCSSFPPPDREAPQGVGQRVLHKTSSDWMPRFLTCSKHTSKQTATPHSEITSGNELLPARAKLTPKTDRAVKVTGHEHRFHSQLKCIKDV